MDTNPAQHDEDTRPGAEDRVPIAMAPSRPDDPIVTAAAAGKTTPERSTPRTNVHQPSQRHNRGPPLDDDDEPVERLAGDLLVGADAIRAFLVHLGMPEDTDVYYIKRAGIWPIGKTGGDGGNLIASKRRLTRHAQKITAPQKSDAI
jgi:hypothetical protein